MQKAFSVAAAIVALAIAAACAAGDNAATLVAPRGPAFSKSAPVNPDPSVQIQFPLNDAALGFKSDHIATYVVGNVSVYADAVCGVHALMFATNGGDVTMQTNDSKYSDRHCPDYPRKLGIVLRDDAGNIVTQFSIAGAMNQRSVEDLTAPMAIGSTIARGLVFGSDPLCNSLRWAIFQADGVTPIGADRVNVTRVDASTWHVQSQPYPNDKVLCVGNNTLYHAPVDFTIVAARPMP
jgi:hypothetical protein